jgi:hypothetical protein
MRSPVEVQVQYETRIRSFRKETRLWSVGTTCDSGVTEGYAIQKIAQISPLVGVTWRQYQHPRIQLVGYLLGRVIRR